MRISVYPDAPTVFTIVLFCPENRANIAYNRINLAVRTALPLNHQSLKNIRQ